MKAEAYLEQLNKLDRLIQNKRYEIEHWKAVAVSCNVKMDGERVQSSGPSHKIENAVITYSDLQAELEADVKRAERKRQEIIKTLYENLAPDEYDVLHHIYVQGMLLKEVEAVMNRSRSWVSKTHRRAIKNLQQYLNQEKKHDKETEFCKKTET